MSNIIPSGYKPILDLKKTEQAIKMVKDNFESELAAELKLSRVTSPLFVQGGAGINDDLSGVERPVSFPVKKLGEQRLEVVQSLAKWKRMALADHGYPAGTGLYTDMNAIRPDDDIDPIHSIYVDQWDWELIMRPGERSESYLLNIVTRIYEVMKRLEFILSERYPEIKQLLPDKITCIHAEEALQLYPQLTPIEREKELAKEYGAIFIQGIGGSMADGQKHGSRSPDYDDWTTPTGNGFHGLNGDIIVWDTVRNDSMELSSMGIRVDQDTLQRQLKLAKAEKRAELYWHKRLLAGDFPQTIGGGIGQSRLCMFYLRKAHIGEVQASVWSEETIAVCKNARVPLM